MKGIILAGGLGTRLLPLTKVTNKHLLPIYDRPMIYYPIQKMVDAGITEIILVVGDKSAGEFIRLLGNGNHLGLNHIYYIFQDGEGGIAQALGLCEYLVKNEKFMVILGDNIFQDDLTSFLRQFNQQKSGARIFLKEVDEPQRFGVPRIEDNEIITILEKPPKPPSNYAVTGIYMYPPDVFEIISQLQPSSRGELEITDVNNAYAQRGELKFNFLKGWWTDAGTFNSYRHAWALVLGDEHIK
ncbi:MAG: spore coat protein [Desulfuromonas sp. SDB]|nr:MAG: spore coat protein [Desulfuromonas sp. SDB]